MRNRLCVVLAALVCVLSIDAAADEAPSSGLWDRDTLTGDWGGARTALVDRGIAFSSNYIGEVFANLSGGVSRGSIYQGRLELALDMDLDKLAGWGGAMLHANAYQIHGHGLLPDLHALMGTSNLEARPTTRLFTLWLEQALSGGSASLRIGQLAADDEFILSATSAMFLNTTFGWPSSSSIALPNSGPVFPLAAPGVRLRVDPLENVSFLVAAFSGDPAGGPSTLDPELHNISGTQFSIRGGGFYIAEAQYRINQGEDEAGLPGKYKIGGWYHSGVFADQRLDQAGISLASPLSGVPRNHRGNYALYAIADQTVWQGNARAIDVFLRLSGQPADRNLVSFYADAGVAYTGLFAGRPDDKLGLAFAYQPIGADARALDRDTLMLTGSGFVRDHESVLEISYQARLAPWWSLQPDVQFLFHPGGTIANPRSPASPIGDAFVIGLRTTLKL